MKEKRLILGKNRLVRIPVYRACLTTIYAGGLRLLEGAASRFRMSKLFGSEAQQFAVLLAGPAHFRYGAGVVPGEMMFQRSWQTLIEQHAHG